MVEPTVRVQIFKSMYRDSIILMRIANAVRVTEGVDEAALFMGTEGNKKILQENGLLNAEATQAQPNDLIIAVKGENEQSAEAGLALSVEMLTAKAEDSETSKSQVATLDSALKAVPDANLLMLSVAGTYVYREAAAAIEKGLNLFIFSDNVPIEEEIALKKMALEQQVLCMGPDCGTAYINATGLGFYNKTVKGRVGYIAASGTGLQSSVSELYRLDEGVSHAIGVGGRDVSEDVGGMMTLFAIDLLEEDPQTEIIVLISKPPSTPVLKKLEEKFATISKPIIVCCLGAERPESTPQVTWVPYLAQTAHAAKAVLAGETFTPTESSHAKHEFVGTSLLGLYTGGTLAHEAHIIMEAALGDIDTNMGHSCPDSESLILDLGDDKYTAGRPHPMIDPSTRVDALLELFQQRMPAVVLFDLVLGYGACDDPATPMAEALAACSKIAAEAEHKYLAICSVVGTDIDPQDMEQQQNILKSAGVVITANNHEASFLAAAAMTS